MVAKGLKEQIGAASRKRSGQENRGEKRKYGRRVKEVGGSRLGLWKLATAVNTPETETPI